MERKEKPKISEDEFMAAKIGDILWLDQSLDGKDPNAFDKDGLAPLHHAALNCRLNCMQLLLEKYKVDVNSPSLTGHRAIHLVISQQCKDKTLPCLLFLIDNGADVNSLTNDNMSTLHQAATHGLVKCVQLLLSLGVNVDVVDSNGKTAMQVAKIWDHKKCARIIRDARWKYDKSLEAEERLKLDQMKKLYDELQTEAIHRLHDEQKFYGDVAFSNWCSNQQLDEKVPDISGYDDAKAIQGLQRRVRAAGGIEADFATRMENLTSDAKREGGRKKGKNEKLSSSPQIELTTTGLELKTSFTNETIKKLDVPMLGHQQITNIMHDISLYRTTGFQPTHIYDVQKKKFPLQKPPDDVIMHLAVKPHCDVTDEALLKTK